MGQEGSENPERENLHPIEQAQPSRNVAIQSTEQLNIVRRVYHQETLNKDAGYKAPQKSVWYHCKKFIRTCGCGMDCLRNSLPIIRWLPKYHIKDNLLRDMCAGATVAIMHIPQGMAYALLAEVPAVVGLYMAFFPVLIYVLLGTSPHISMGTFAIACLMAGKVVTQYATPTPLPNPPPAVVYTNLDIASALCMCVGLIQIMMWALRLGAMSTLLSDALVSGFTTASAITVVCAQLKDLFGIKMAKITGNYKVAMIIYEMFHNIQTTNKAALIISIIACSIICLNNELLKPWVSKRSRFPIPIELLVIVSGTLVSKLAKLEAAYGLALAGPIPTGLPAPRVPPIRLLPELALDAFVITMVIYTITMSMAFIFANKEKYEVDPSQECLALGASNVFSSFFGCLPFCASLSRSYIQYQAGARTQITSLVSAVLILCILLWVGPFFEDLPRCVLASVIVASLKGLLMKVKELSMFCKLSKLDAIVWFVTFTVTLIVNIDIGLFAGLLASVGCLFMRSQKSYTCLLGRVFDTDIYLDIRRYSAAHEIPGIKIFHYCGGLNFATKNLFRAKLFRKVGYMKPTDHDLLEDEDLNASVYEFDASISNRLFCVIIDATALSYVDASGIDTLVAVTSELEASDITVLLTGANGPVLEMIERHNSLHKKSGRLHLDTFPTVHDAVVYYLMDSKHRESRDNINVIVHKE